MSGAFPAFSNLPLRDKGLVVVAVPVLALLIVLVAMVLVQREEQQAEHALQHTMDIRQNLQLALTLLIDAETGTRGYLLTDRAEWLDPYQNALGQFPRVMERLDQLVVEDPGQTARLNLMKQVAGNRLEHLVVLQTVHGRRSIAELQGELARSKATMDQARGIFGAMLGDEEQRLRLRTNHVQRVRTWLYALIAAMVLAGLGGGLAAAWLFGRHITRRVERLSESAGLLATRQPLPPADGGADEIGRLSSVVHEADALLSGRERELREAQVFLEHLMETSPAVVVRQDPNTWDVIYVSPNVERILGYVSEEVRHKRDFWMSRIHPDDREHVLELDRRAISEHADQLEMEYRFQHKDGSYLWLVSYVRIEYNQAGEPTEFLGHRLNITARRRAEESLREREASLDAANKELEAFSYSVSHDLRAPLRSIDGFSQALIEDYGEQIDAPGKSYLQRVRTATQRMGLLIDDLLNLSRVTRSPLRRTRVNLSALAQSIAHDLRQTQPERSAEFVIAPDLEDDCDANLMRVVLENLLGNAWKFTGRHPAARIEFGRDGDAYFVRDDGAGFDPAYKTKLFGAFQRLHHASDFAGTGVGLATVQRIIRRHGGRVSADGAPEKGATFFFTLHS
jgi:PAS domain S-box-containing protein